MSDAGDRVVMTGEQLSRTVTRMAHEILEKNTGDERLAVVGIHTRGAHLARRLHAILSDIAGRDVPLGDLDISFYRDDVAARGAYGVVPATPNPIVKSTDLDFEVDGATVVLVDDVLYTGRTIRAAIDALFDYGRPARVQLAVLVDRGHRELPIRPDYIGKNLPTAPRERIHVRLAEVDGSDEVVLVSPAGED
jgi:pyrimidine operon attenuation protein/uracil phosphoribosyltransferase